MTVVKISDLNRHYQGHARSIPTATTFANGRMFLLGPASDEFDIAFREFLQITNKEFSRYLSTLSSVHGTNSISTPWGLNLIVYFLDYALESPSGLFVVNSTELNLINYFRSFHVGRKQRKRLNAVANVLSDWKNPKQELIAQTFLKIPDVTTDCIREVTSKSVLRTIEDNEQFVTSFAHEALTPIQYIRSSIELVLKSDKIKQHHKETLEDAMLSLDNMRTDLEGVRLIFREKNLGKPDRIEYQDIDAREIVSKWVQNYKSDLIQKNLTTIFQPQYGKWTIRVVPAYFEVMIKNLIQNAIKYSFDASTYKEPGKILLNFESRSNAFSITNFGVLIKEEEIESKSIFNPSVRGVESSDRRRTGRGQGLHLVDIVANLHNAKITVSSKVQNPGSKNEFARTAFSVHFPTSRGGL